VWALSVGGAATLIAALVYFGVGDQTGAAWVLFGAAMVIAVVLYCSPQSTRRS
jgi:archaellum component FlaF (FlaF/FlaG flagellin family)